MKRLSSSNVEKFKPIGFFSALAVLGLLAGCATRNLNPPSARANTGYVDFYTDPAANVCWEVTRFHEASGTFQAIFSNYEPAAGILRLAFAPGPQRLRINLLNRVVTKPAELVVDVQNGKITPVRVTLAKTGQTI